MSDRPTIDAEECADLLRCSVEQIEDMARKGDLPGLKIGRGWIFIRQDLLYYLADKARSDAEARKSARSPGVKKLVAKQRRQVPPALPCA